MQNHITRRQSLGLSITGPHSTNRRRRHPMAWLLAAFILVPSIAAILVTLFR